MKRLAFCVALVLATGQVAIFADDLDDALQAMKDNQSSKDAAKTKELAAASHATAQKWMTATAPTDAEKENYEARARYAKEVDSYSEYSLYAMAIQSDARTAMDLISTLQKQNPKSKYLEMPDLLIMQADAALGRKDTAGALTYANRLIASANAKAPEGISADAWEHSKTAGLGRAYWIAGVIQGEQKRDKDCDRNLRAALPLIKGNTAMLGPALFYLGVANYNLARLTLSKAKMLEAAKFSEDSAKIAGPYQDQAYKNASLMKTEAASMR